MIQTIQSSVNNSGSYSGGLLQDIRAALLMKNLRDLGGRGPFEATCDRLRVATPHDLEVTLPVLFEALDSDDEQVRRNARNMIDVIKESEDRPIQEILFNVASEERWAERPEAMSKAVNCLKELKNQNIRDLHFYWKVFYVGKNLIRSNNLERRWMGNLILRSFVGRNEDAWGECYDFAEEMFCKGKTEEALEIFTYLIGNEINFNSKAQISPFFLKKLIHQARLLFYSLNSGEQSAAYFFLSQIVRLGKDEQVDMIPREVFRDWWELPGARGKVRKLGWGDALDTVRQRSFTLLKELIERRSLAGLPEELRAFVDTCIADTESQDRFAKRLPKIIAAKNEEDANRSAEIDRRREEERARENLV